ncbi:MAG: hypothetical protein ACYDCH_09480, partial [Gaiellaceae bacterium]
MTQSLRSRLFQAIALTVAVCVGLTVVVGLALTRRAVDRGALLDVSHQADLIAGSQGVESTITPHFRELKQYLKRQNETYRTTTGGLPATAVAALAHGRPADGSVRFDGVDYFFGARLVSGQSRPFVLL